MTLQSGNLAALADTSTVDTTADYGDIFRGFFKQAGSAYIVKELGSGTTAPPVNTTGSTDTGVGELSAGKTVISTNLVVVGLGVVVISIIAFAALRGK